MPFCLKYYRSALFLVLWCFLPASAFAVAGTCSSVFFKSKGKSPQSAQSIVPRFIDLSTAHPFPVLVQQRVQHAVQILSTKPQAVPRSIEVSLDLSRKSFFEALYSTGFVRADRVGKIVSDKLITTRALEYFLGKRFREFSPRGVGLKEFLVLKNIVDASGRVVRDTAEVTAELKDMFPDGVILKPTSGKASDGKGFLGKAEDIAHALTATPKDPNAIVFYSSSELKTAVANQNKDVLQSGERFFLMDRIKGSVLDGDRKEAREFRLHILNGQVISGATINRWWEWVHPTNIKAIEESAQNLFDLLPAGFKQGQAYSIDVIATSGGRIQLIEINTNGGVYGATWSGFSSIPAIIKAHTDVLEKVYDWRITGPAAQFYKEGLANSKWFLKIEFEELAIYLEQGVATEKQAVDILKSHIAAIVLPSLKLLKQVPDRDKTEEMRSAEIFLKSYADFLKPVKEYGDPAWIIFDSWMMTQI